MRGAFDEDIRLGSLYVTEAITDFGSLFIERLVSYLRMLHITWYFSVLFMISRMHCEQEARPSRTFGGLSCSEGSGRLNALPLSQSQSTFLSVQCPASAG